MAIGAFGKSLGDVASDDNKVPIIPQAGSNDYYLVVNTQNKTTKKILATSNYPTVNTFADLPSSGMLTNDIIVVRTTTGVIGFRKLKGLYIYTGTAWERLSPSFHATSVYYDNSSSELSATNVNTAIDEVKNSIGVIADESVTNTKLSHVATGTVKGRATAGTGEVEDLDIDTTLKTALNLSKSDVGLGNVENKSSATIRGEIVDADIPSTIARDSEIPSGNQVIDWTTDQGSTNIHSGNYTNTTYSVQDGELSQNNFSDILKNKLDAIESGADVTDSTNVSSAGALMKSGGTMTGFLNLVGGSTFGNSATTNTGGTTSISILAPGENADAILYFGTQYSSNSTLAKKAAIIAEGQTSYSRSKLHFCLDATSNNASTYNASLSNSKLTIDWENGGRVGILKTDPDYTLDVNGTGNFSGALIVGDGSNGESEIKIYKSDNNVADHLQFYNGTTRVGEIGAEDSSWLRINQETDKNIYTPRMFRADGGFQVNGNDVITGSGVHTGNGSALISLNASNLSSGTVSADRLPFTESGKSAVGNFGQFYPHSSYTDFNADVADWGWSFVQGTTNAPNTTSSQWYRLRCGLGSGYGFQSGSGDYWLELAYPRFSQSTAGCYMRTCENGTISAWVEIAPEFDGVLNDGDLKATRTGYRSGSYTMMKYSQFAYSSSGDYATVHGRVEIRAESGWSSGSSLIMRLDNLGYDNRKVYIYGTLDVSGAVSKGSGSFDIAHPDPAKKDTHRLRHYFVETPSAGGNIYKYQIDCNEGDNYIDLPDYFQHLNKDSLVWVNPFKHFGRAWGEVVEGGKRAKIVVEKKGLYNVLIFGDRKDEIAMKDFNEFGIEYQIKKKEKKNVNK